MAEGIFAVIFLAHLGEFWGGGGHFYSDFEVTLGILTCMLFANSGEFWGSCGHFSSDFWLDFGHF